MASSMLVHLMLMAHFSQFVDMPFTTLTILLSGVIRGTECMLKLVGSSDEMSKYFRSRDIQPIYCLSIFMVKLYMISNDLTTCGEATSGRLKSYLKIIEAITFSQRVGQKISFSSIIMSKQ